MKEECCSWVKDEFDRAYHDNEWGNPCHDDQKIFEMLILEGMQAGLSWNTILKKRDNFQKAFDQFDYHVVAKYDEDKIQALLQDAGIIRNRLKIRSAVKSAQMFLEVQKEFGTFDHYIWSFADHKQIVNEWTDIKQMPASNELSDKMSKDLKKRGFNFVGTTICYSFMQAIGMINDHVISCPQYRKCIES